MKPIEVSKETYYLYIKRYSGLLFHRIDETKSIVNPKYLLLPFKSIYFSIEKSKL